MTFKKRIRKSGSRTLTKLFSYLTFPKTMAKQVDSTKIIEKVATQIEQSNLISRDLSWLEFNKRVLSQAQNEDRNVLDRLKFLAITTSNLDEFFTIRVGNLYNYIDYGKERVDYSGLRELPFRKELLRNVKEFVAAQNRCFLDQLVPLLAKEQVHITGVEALESTEKEEVSTYFERTVYPMLTPMLIDYTHVFPVLQAKVLIFGVVTQVKGSSAEEDRKVSFVQIPANLPRFYGLERDEETLFVPIEEIVRSQIKRLYRNVEIVSVCLMRIIRNGDFTLEESDDIESDFIDEIRQKIKSRRLGRVVRIEVEPNFSTEILDLLKKRWEIDDYNVFTSEGLLDYSSLWQIVKHPDLKELLPVVHAPVPPLGIQRERFSSIFELMRERDVLLHHPYNNFEPVLQLLEQAAEDPKVLSIKLTIYRLAKNSRVTEALLKAAENGKNVAVLFEVKARFDEENNIREAQRLQKAGCFVIYGIGLLKTHTKLLLIVRNEGDKVVRYAHLSSGNYNEDTARLYTDIGLLTTNEEYTHDISDFFNVITGHSSPVRYRNLITAPGQLRERLVELIRQEADNAQKGLPAGICLKLNSLEDRATIEELYKASQAGVPIELIVRGICCLRPGRKGLSENIRVKSIVGDFLEHSRIFYFHNAGDPIIYGGSADVMVRSFDKRIESLFAFVDPHVRKQVIHILDYNLRDNQNSFYMLENGSYERCPCEEIEAPLNIHRAFFEVRTTDLEEVGLFKKTADVATASEEIPTETLPMP